jgi:hypothetical protein
MGAINRRNTLGKCTAQLGNNALELRRTFVDYAALLQITAWMVKMMTPPHNGDPPP